MFATDAPKNSKQELTFRVSVAKNEIDIPPKISIVPKVFCKHYYSIQRIGKYSWKQLQASAKWL